jgi:hypothetical protein
MQFLKGFLRNLTLLLLLSVGLYLLFPQMMLRAAGSLGRLTGPFAVLAILVLSLPLLGKKK